MIKFILWFQHPGQILACITLGTGGNFLKSRVSPAGETGAFRAAGFSGGNQFPPEAPHGLRRGLGSPFLQHPGQILACITLGTGGNFLKSRVSPAGETGA